MTNMSAALVSVPPAGFMPRPSPSPFVNQSGTFFTRSVEDAETVLGTWIGEEQADAEGFVDLGFLLAFADFALTDVTTGITVQMSTNFTGTARVGDWIEVTIAVRARFKELIFADAIIASQAGPELMRVQGMFRPFEKHIR